MAQHSRAYLKLQLDTILKKIRGEWITQTEHEEQYQRAANVREQTKVGRLST